MRAWPASERCLAWDSSSRRPSVSIEVASAAAPSPQTAKVVVAHCIESGCTRNVLQSHDGPLTNPAPVGAGANLAPVGAGANLAPVGAGECQFPPHQPYSAPAGDAVRRLAQPGRAALGARPLDRPVADVLR